MGTTRRKPGSLGPYVEGYSAWLVGRGYTALTARNMLKDFGQVGRWLAVEHVEVQQCQISSWGGFWPIGAGPAAGGFPGCGG